MGSPPYVMNRRVRPEWVRRRTHVLVEPLPAGSDGVPQNCLSRTACCRSKRTGVFRDDELLWRVRQYEGMFTFDKNSSYMMPAHFGPRQFDPRASGWYHDVTAITTSYVTDRDQLSQYIPAPFVVTDEAVLTVV